MTDELNKLLNQHKQLQKQDFFRFGYGALALGVIAVVIITYVFHDPGRMLWVFVGLFGFFGTLFFVTGALVEKWDHAVKLLPQKLDQIYAYQFKSTNVKLEGALTVQKISAIHLFLEGGGFLSLRIQPGSEVNVLQTLQQQLPHAELRM